MEEWTMFTTTRPLSPLGRMPDRPPVCPPTRTATHTLCKHFCSQLVLWLLEPKKSNEVHRQTCKTAFIVEKPLNSFFFKL